MKTKLATLYKDHIILEFPYDASLVSAVRDLPSRTWNPAAKNWKVPVNSFVLRKIQEWGFDLVDITKREPDRPYESNPYLLRKHLSNVLQTHLRPYQMEGLCFLNQNNGNGLIADEQGLGKTLTAIAWVQTHQPLKTIVVCPATIKFVWQEQFKKHAGKSTIIAEGSVPHIDSLAPGEVLIINYEMLINRGKDTNKRECLSSWGKWIERQNCDAIIVDESQRIKEMSSKRTKAIRTLARKMKHRIFLSGTPIMSRPIEIFCPANLLDPESFSNRFSFAMRYCGAHHNGFGWQFNGATNLEELHEQLQKIMIRHLKKEVLTELPEKQYSNIPVKLDNWKEYLKARDNFLSWVKENKGPNAVLSAAGNEVITKLTHLKHLAALGKLNAGIEWILDFLETTERKLVVFGHHQDVIERIMSILEKEGVGAVSITGGTDIKKRGWIVQQFQENPDVMVFVGNIQATGTGITLTAADTVLFVEFPWTPSDLDQAADRVHRLGQTSENVNIYYLVARGSLDEDICDLLDEKRKVVQQVLEGTQSTDIPLFQELLKRM
jgi:SWI/SNF-related matrix-associated actin-dependent regulator of chromatin subfamily A-like protein 1